MTARATTDARGGARGGGRRGRAAGLALAATLAALAAPAARATAEAEAYAAAQRLVEARCLGCHGPDEPEAGLDLTPERLARATVNVPSHTQPGLRLVDPGRPDRSALYLKTLPATEGHYRGPRMPMRAAPLDAAETAVLKNWIGSFDPAVWGEPAPAAAAEAAPSAESRAPEGSRPVPIFQDTRLLQLPTTETLGPTGIETRFLHRFKESVEEAGWYGLGGLDGGAWTSLGVAVGLGPRFDLELRRTNLFKDWALNGKLALATQRPDGSPLSVAVELGYEYLQERSAANRNRVSLSVPIARRFGERLSLLAVPMYASRANPFDPDDTGGTVALGLGGEFWLNPHLSLTGEWIGQLAGVDLPYQSGSVAFSIFTSRHIFRLVLTNTSGMHTSLYAPGGELDWSEGEFRLGFNIVRTFDRAGSRRASVP
jgi:hypothetical protein